MTACVDGRAASNRALRGSSENCSSTGGSHRRRPSPAHAPTRMLSIRCNQRRPVGSTSASCFPGRSGWLNNCHAGTHTCRRGTLAVCQASHRRLPMICVRGDLGLGLELLEIGCRPLHKSHPLSSPAWGHIPHVHRGPNSLYAPYAPTLASRYRHRAPAVKRARWRYHEASWTTTIRLLRTAAPVAARKPASTAPTKLSPVRYLAKRPYRQNLSSERVVN